MLKKYLAGVKIRAVSTIDGNDYILSNLFILF